MDFKQLEVFVSVAKHKSFSKASKELFLTQPTISSHIQNLEKELDSVLINRSNKVLTLTNSGDILYQHAIDILNNCKKAVYDIKEYSGRIEGVIDIACSSVPESYILPDFLKHFSLIYPDVKFNISHHDSQCAISEILNETVSFGLVGSEPKNSQIKSIDLVSDELVLITPYDLDINSDNGYIDLETLYDLNFIMRKEGSGTRNLVLNKLSKSNFQINKINTIAHVESNESIKEMVRLGLGVSFASYISIIDYLNNQSLKFYRIKDLNLYRNFYFIYSKKKTFTPLEDKFLRYLFDYFCIENK